MSLTENILDSKCSLLNAYLHSRGSSAWAKDAFNKPHSRGVS